MRIKELSIGDWVCIGECGQHVGEIGRVVAISAESNYIGILTTHIIEECEDDVLPIPLTPEILEKNGIALAEDYDEYSALYTCPQFSVIKYGDSYTFEVPQARVCVKYVHELQRVMRLAKVGKKIEV